MKLVSYNIQYGLGKDSRYDLARIAKEVDGADVIALQEVERHWQRSGCTDQPAVIASHLPDHHWVYGANLDMDASFRDAAGRLVNRRRQFGTMILSRSPIISSRNYLLPKYGTLTQHSIQHGALESVIGTSRTGPVRIYSVHLSHLSSATRMPQVEALLAAHARAPSEGGAWCGGHPDPSAGWTEGEMPPMPAEAILMGDFNFDWDGPEYDRIVGPASERYGRLNRLTGFVDAWVASGHREDEGATIPAGRRIDFCFVSASFASRVKSCRIDGETVGSDHQPLWVEMDL
ncbi:MAG TPA: endonuclease/exonuclease/phosphatase family protein [Casimicrobiaceae bacterium]|nr:endonuclease/exonuclease/phosphatase family protein [Casimicrobiaceae bacterium]